MTRYIVYVKDPQTGRTRIQHNVATKKKAEDIVDMYGHLYDGMWIKAIGKRKKRRRKK